MKKIKERTQHGGDAISERCLYIVDKNKIKRYVLGKNCKPLVIVRNRLFRCDDDFMIPNREGGDAIIPYRVDSTQPMGKGDTQIQTKITMAYIRLAKLNNNKSAISKIGGLDIGITKIMYLIVAIVVVASLVGGFV